MVHISPHFSICAPAYGEIGKKIYNGLDQLLSKESNSIHKVYLVNTKMAGVNKADTIEKMVDIGIKSQIETNEDLFKFVQKILLIPETAGVIMAAAICDFEPVQLDADGQKGKLTITEFGKGQKRLHHINSVTLQLNPSQKIIDIIKATRPDIFLVTFKTSAGITKDELFKQAHHNLKRSNSDFVFANDIQNYQNFIVNRTGEILEAKDRNELVQLFCSKLIEFIAKRKIIPLFDSRDNQLPEA